MLRLIFVLTSFLLISPLASADSITFSRAYLLEFNQFSGKCELSSRLSIFDFDMPSRDSSGIYQLSYAEDVTPAADVNSEWILKLTSQNTGNPAQPFQVMYFKIKATSENLEKIRKSNSGLAYTLALTEDPKCTEAYLIQSFETWFE